jgi:hypothetical protein
MLRTGIPCPSILVATTNPAQQDWFCVIGTNCSASRVHLSEAI